MTERKTLITGTVTATDAKTSKNGNPYYIIRIDPTGERFGQYDNGAFEVIASGEMAVAAQDIANGDTVSLACQITANTWNERTFIKLSLAEVVAHAKPTGVTMAQDGRADADDLPF